MQEKLETLTDDTLLDRMSYEPSNYIAEGCPLHDKKESE